MAHVAGMVVDPGMWAGRRQMGVAAVVESVSRRAHTVSEWVQTVLAVLAEVRIDC